MNSFSENSSRRFLPIAISWAAVVIWALLIFYVSAQPSLSTHWGIWDFILRKAAHMCEYAVLFLLLWNALAQLKLRERTSLLLGAFLAVCYAASDEFHQTFVPGRSGEPRDVAIDACGVIIALLALTYVRRRLARRPAAAARE